MRRPRLVIALAFLVAAIIGTAIALLRSDASDIALAPSGSFTIGGEYSSANTPAGLRYGSWSGSDQHTGTLMSVPFRAWFGIAMTIDGYPANPGNNIRLERVDTGESIPLTVPNAGETWQLVTVGVPLQWLGRSVRLIATDNATETRGWLGIAALHRANLLQTIVADARMRLLGFTLLTSVFFAPCLAAGDALRRRLSLPSLYLFSATLLIAGAAAETMFFLTMISEPIADFAAVAALIFGTWFTVRAARERQLGALLRTPDAALPFLVTGACALLYLIAITLTVPVITPMNAFTPQLGQLPADSWLPEILSQHIAAHVAPKPFLGDWLSSDRPPLQSGFDLISMSVFRNVDAGGARYEAIGMLLQATVFGLLFTLARTFGAKTRGSLAIVSLAVFSGFFYSNTIFVWPKLIAAAYLAISVAIGCAPGKLTVERSIAIGAAFAFAMLSHGGVAFTVPALMIALVVAQRRAAVRILGVSIACFIVITAPWLWYQHVYDPPGDRLLKWHLSGNMDPTPVPFTKLLIDAYAEVPASTIIANKVENVRFLFNEPANGTVTHGAAPREFFIVRHAIGVLALPFAIALCLMPFRRFRRASIAAWIATGSLAFWCLVMYMPDATSVHQGSYLTMMLVFLAGGLLLTELWPLFALAFALQFYDFVHLWIAPFINGSAVAPTGILAIAICSIILGGLLWTSSSLEKSADLAADECAAYTG